MKCYYCINKENLVKEATESGNHWVCPNHTKKASDKNFKKLVKILAKAANVDMNDPGIKLLLAMEKES